MSVRLAALWAAGGQYSLFLLGFAVSVLLARYFIGPEDLGLYSTAFTVIAIAQGFQDFGINRYLVGHESPDESHYAAAQALAARIAVAILGVNLLLTWLMPIVFHREALRWPMLILTLTQPAIALTTVPIARLQRRLDFRRTVMIDAAGAVLGAAVTVALAALQWGAVALAGGAAATQVTRALLAQAMQPSWTHVFARSGELGAMVRFGTGNSVMVALGSAGGRVPELVLSRLVGFDAYGLFGRAAGLATQLRQLISGAIGNVQYAVLAKKRSEGQPLGPTYLTVTAIATGTVWSAMLWLALASGPVVVGLFGDRWAGAAPLLMWLALSELIFLAVPMHSDMLLMVNRMGLAVRLSIVDNVMSAASLIIGAVISVEWAAGLRIAYALAWVALYLPFAASFSGFKLSAMFAVYVRSAAVAVCFVAPLGVWTVARQPAPLGLLQCLLAGGAGLPVALLCAALLRHPLWSEVRRAAQRGSRDRG